MIKIKSLTVFFFTDKNLSLPFIAQRGKNCSSQQSGCFQLFPLHFLFFASDFVASKLHVQILENLCCFSSLPVSLSLPLGPPAAEVCGNNHPPTVCSLAARPALCMGLFMFLSTNNNLKERSLSSPGNATVWNSVQELNQGQGPQTGGADQGNTTSVQTNDSGQHSPLMWELLDIRRGGLQLLLPVWLAYSDLSEGGFD